MPIGIRSSEPRTTGTAVRKSVEVLDRSSASWNFLASGAIRPQAEKHAMKASVASARFHPGDRRTERFSDEAMRARLRRRPLGRLINLGHLVRTSAAQAKRS